MYASYQDYIERFGGRAIPDEADFNRLALRAGPLLDRLTGGRAAKFQDRDGKLALACCAVTEKLYEQEERKRRDPGSGSVAGGIEHRACGSGGDVSVRDRPALSRRAGIYRLLSAPRETSH